jgi:glutaredoxin 3
MTTQKKIEVYTTNPCPYCVRVKDLFDRKGYEYELIQVSQSREEMIARTGGPRTVPQVFIDNVYIGDSETIVNLERDDKLDALVKGF